MVDNLLTLSVPSEGYYRNAYMLCLFSVIAHFVDIEEIVGHSSTFLFIITSHLKSLNIYKTNNWAYICMTCKLQHGLKYGSWYLEIIKVRQVVECAWLDWGNLIGIQITTKYEIRTKYYVNMRPNKPWESPKSNLGEPSL